MSGLDFERRKQSSVQLNMTPLIDIVFLLLIFFILSSHFVSERGFSVKLPKAAHASEQHHETITVTIDASSSIFIDERQVSIEELASGLKEELNLKNVETVVIKADAGVDIGFAVQVMDAAKEADATGLVILTRALDDEKNQ